MYLHVEHNTDYTYYYKMRARNIGDEFLMKTEKKNK